MNTTRLIALLVVAVTFAACGGGSPSTPSSNSPLQGTWRGTLTIQADAQPAVAAPTTWTFTELSGGSGHGYTTTIQTQHPWFAPTTTANAVLIDSQFQADGSYASPRGCSGVFSSLGTGDAHSVKATFHGVDCGTSTFTGSVDLAR